MRFPNAAKGVKKIFSAQILALIAAICIVVAAILLVVMYASMSAGNNSVNVGSGISAIGVLVCFTGYAVLAIIAFIMNIVGISQAAKDEGNFTAALFALIIGIIATILYAVFNMLYIEIAADICKVVSSAMELFVTLSIIQGCINFADQLNRGDIAQKGSNIFKIILVMYTLILIAYLINVFIVTAVSAVIAAVLLIVAAVLNIIQYILYLSFLSKAKKMLAES